MGYNSYDLTARTARATSGRFFEKTNDELFTQNKLRTAHEDMLIYGKIREARDSDAHPNSIPIIISLDVTGSMSTIPRMFIQDGLPTIVSKIIQAGIADPQICFTAIGDHEYDRAPFQAGQFESSDDLMDNWLQKTWLEGGGGSNFGESYALSWKFAADHTICDHTEKRKQKGFLFSIGDEPNLRLYPATILNTIFGGQNQEETDITLFEKASVNWDLYHISIEHGRGKTSPNWRQLFGDKLYIIEDFLDIPNIISNIVLAGSNLSITDYSNDVKPTSKIEDIKITL